MTPELFNRLAAPIAGDHPGGEEAAFLPVCDEIREARRADDPALAQGEWERELKAAQWPRVRQLCESVLQSTSKDLQVACWYIEALTHLHGFSGLAFGFEVLAVLVDDFWEFAYPALDDDLEERAGKVEWLNKQLPFAIRSIPLTAQEAGGYSWLKWEESRKTANLGLKDAAAQEKALAEGKLTAEEFDKAAAATGRAFYEALQPAIQRSAERIAAVEAHLDERLGTAAPGLRAVREAVGDCATVVTRIMTSMGGIAAEQAIVMEPARAPGAAAITAHPAAQPGTPVGAIRSRTEAIATLRLVAQYFRYNEPHSPVALLAERAARWAEMPLEGWLAAVVKDDSTLHQLRELLDIQPR